MNDSGTKFHNELGVAFTDGGDLTPVAGAVDPYKGLYAQVDKLDAAKGEADVSGTAQDGATVFIGEKEFPVVDGKWNGKLTGLAAHNDLTVEQWINGEKISERPFAIDFSVAALSEVKAAFDSADVLNDAIVSGKGEPGADIAIEDGNGITTKGEVDDQGTFSIPVVAPGAGIQKFTVTQTVGAIHSVPETISLDYGLAGEVTSPADKTDLNGATSVDFKGSAMQGSKASVFEGDTRVSDTVTANGKNQWTATVKDITATEHTYTVKMLSKGNLTTEKTITLNPGQSSATAPTADVTFDSTLTNLATIGGKGQDGAQIVVKVNGTQIGTTQTVAQGMWSMNVPASVGAGSHTFTVEQTVGGKPAGSVSTTKDFGAKVDATGPTAEFAGSSTTITGTGAEGASVQLSEGGKNIGQPVTVNGGNWSIPVTEIQDGKHTYTATQTAAGNIVTTDDITATRNTARVNIAQTNLTDGSEFTAGTQTFTGTGTPGGTISLNPTYPSGEAPSETTVGWDGNWTIDRYLGDGPYTIGITQTAKGKSDSISSINLKPHHDGVANPFTSNTKDGATFASGGPVTFTGTGDSKNGGTVTMKYIYPDTIQSVTVPVGPDGNWSITQGMGYGPYTVEFSQNVNGVVTPSGPINLLPVGWPTAVDKQFTSDTKDGGTFTSGGPVTFTGTGAGKSGGTVTMKYIFPDTIQSVTVPVGEDGNWSITQGMGYGPYTVEFSQNVGGVVTPSGPINLLPVGWPVEVPVDKPFTSNTHDGDTFADGGPVTFTGTGAGKSGGTVTMKYIFPDTIQSATVPVNKDGSWSITQGMGNGPYTVEFSQNLNGVVTPGGPINLKPLGGGTR